MTILHSLNAAIPETLLPPAVRTASANGTGVDCAKYDGTAKVVLNIGTVTGTTPTLDVKLQESDTSGGTYTDIPGAVFPQQASASQLQLHVDISARKRWIRAVATIGGSSPSFPCSTELYGMPKVT